jgi:N6-L-threonylcarbamoyladenine synthase/protein kinase Bud32
MCVEVTERALAHAGKDEVLLVGGVGANKRLQAMLAAMCEERGATLFVPENRFIGDNGAMIALTGSIMLECGQTLSIESSHVRPGYRSDEVVVQWRDNTSSLNYSQAEIPVNGFARGAEAVIERIGPLVQKRRLPKIYRTKALNRKLVGERTRAEARLLSAARRHGVRTPIIHDLTHDTIDMEYLEGTPLKCALTQENVLRAGQTVGKLHKGAIIHGDLTTSNMIVVENSVALIDFGLAYISDETESQGVDVHVFFQTLESTSSEADTLKKTFVEGYQSAFSDADEILDRVEEIRLRGRYL